MKEKRGLSGIIETIVLVLLVLLAVGIVWAVVQGLIVGKTEEIAQMSNTLELQITKVNTTNQPADTIAVQVERGAGEGDIAGIRFILDNGDENSLIDNTNADAKLQPYAKKTFDVTSTDFDLTTLKKVEVVAIFEDEAGEFYYGSTALDSYSVE